jgi:hypothetical protein
MSNDLLDRITAEISKTGFPLELRAASYLRDRGYHVATNIYFVDKDEEKAREVDIRALKNVFLDNRRRAVRHCLLIECKKSSSRPWVFFTSEAASYDQTVTDTLCHGIDYDHWIPTMDDVREMQERHPWFRDSQRGRSFFEPFSSGGNDTNQTINKAILGAIKACIEAHQTNFAAGYVGMRNATFYYPIVVFDGELFIANLSGRDLVVTPTDSVLVSAHYRSAKYPDDQKHTVLVVRESAFNLAVQDLDDWLQYCAARLKAYPRCFAIPRRKPETAKRRRRASKTARTGTQAKR